jgi:methylated-DNA-protein-cysteine methyltransferase-like protein
MAVRYYEAVWDLVRQIPRGKVMCYGQIATLLGTPRGARGVGDAMFHAVDDVPWQRVINAKGEISLGGHPDRPRLQREMLEAEGVLFDAVNRLDLKRYLWWPAGSEPARR